LLQPALGSAWFAVAGYPVYLPWRLFEWWYAYDAYAPHVFERAGTLAASGGAAGALFAVLNSVWRARQNQLVTTFGSARWATLKEMAAAGLFKPKGVFLGRVDDSYLRHEGPEHVMCFAPTRSGKVVGLVLPTLLSWTSSAVVHDIKGENWQLTAGWRSSFSHCLLFDPTDVRSARYNPLLEVRKGACEVRRQRNLAPVCTENSSTSSGRRDLNRLTTNAPSRWRIASIAPEDALILPHRATPSGCDFWERQVQAREQRSNINRLRVPY
jgi:type IV secretion system protein VirD4